MRSKSVEMQCRQIAVQTSYRNGSNPETAPQYFQISVNVIEARKLTWLNPHSANSYVIVVLGKKKRRTGIRRNMQDPYYREHFMFEQYMTIREIQCSYIWLAVMEPRCCAPPQVLGEASIDLAAVWAQPYHQVFHKWAQLSLPQNSGAGATGFLKVDISIIFRGDIQVMPVAIDGDKADDNLLLPSGSEQQPANYVVNIYGVFGLPNQGHGQGVKRYGTPPSTFIRVSFCGLAGKTAVQHRTNHPTFCEQISMVEMFPNMSEVIRFEVCSAEGCYTKVLTATSLKLGHISHDGENGFLPTFGPSLIHMYGGLAGVNEEGPFYRGALLMSLRTIVPYYQQTLKSVNVEPVPPIRPDNLWLLEDFCILCPVLEVSMLDRQVCGKYCGVAVTIGELPIEDDGDEEFFAMMTELKLRKLHYTGAMEVWKSIPVYGYLSFAKAFPVLQLAARLPDFRFRMYRNNMVYGILSDLEKTLLHVEDRLKNAQYTSPCELVDELNGAIDTTSANLLKYLDIIQYSTPSTGSLDEVTLRYSTELDQKQLALQKDDIEKIYQQLTKRTKCTLTMNLIRSVMKPNEYSTTTKKELKLMIAEIRALTENLRSLIYKTSEGWPDLVIWMLNGGSRVAYYKIPVADVIYSVIPEQNGRNCGRIHTIYLKPLKCAKHPNTMSTNCYCIAAKVEVMLWAGLFRQIQAFEECLPKGYFLKIKDYDMCVKTKTMMVECRAFICKGKLNNNVNPTNQICPFVRINALSTVKETAKKRKSLTPVWNQVLKVRKLIYATQDRLVDSPPTVMVEVCSTDNAGKIELIGRYQALPVLEDRPSYEFAPKLQWYDIHKGTEHMGQVLMSVQLLQIPETLIKSTIYSPSDETCVIPEFKDEIADSDDVEPLPCELVPKTTTYKVDVYWWGLRDVNSARRPCVSLEIDELVIKSDIIIDKKTNCNFPNGKINHSFEAPLDETYCPPLNIRLYDNSTFGRTLFLGSNVVKNPGKYIVNWLPKTEREASLKSASINSSKFFQVAQMLYVKKSRTSSTDSEFSLKRTFPSKTKRSTWRKLFSRKEPDEEEYVLLPLFFKERDQRQLKKCPKSPEYKDWWMRYFASQKDTEDDSSWEKITIFNSELELQPEFSKFKDWCSTVKLYNGNKTGIPGKDAQLYCGFLKAGIAIYKWPPTHGTKVVSCSGVDLVEGYFKDHPSNEPTKFLIRAYVVQATALVPKAFTGRSDSYIVISCGSKHLGDRKNFVPNDLNPVFGKMYEFRCTLPEDYLLTISLYDYDANSPDEMIGTTRIDLEDRIYTKHRARVGLSSEYYITGPAKWRDYTKPSSILEELCIKNHMPPPSFPDAATVIVNNVEYRDMEDKHYTSASERKENICLSLLRQWQTLPMCGYHLVPEHVETRTLMHPEKPGFAQGLLHMWVDIFPLDPDMYVPPPMDITPRKMEDYELRVIVWDVQKIRLDQEFAKKVLDIYVRVWIGNSEFAQYTDIHYNTSTGEGSFNWRMIFHFQYGHAEKKLIMQEKGPFTEVEERVHPILVVQVMDSDAATQDDFLASLTLALSDMPRGLKQASKCTLEELEKANKLDLFTAMSTRGWWPLTVTDRNTGARRCSGIIDMELSLLPKEKAILMPVGLGREPPSPLPAPNRKESAGFCFNDLNLRKHKPYLIIAFVIFVIAALVIWKYFGIIHELIAEN